MYTNEFVYHSQVLFPIDIHLFKVNNGNTRTMCETCSKLRKDTRTMSLNRFCNLSTMTANYTNVEKNLFIYTH